MKERLSTALDMNSGESSVNSQFRRKNRRFWRVGTIECGGNTIVVVFDCLIRLIYLIVCSRFIA
jgi:hypothetical protein